MEKRNKKIILLNEIESTNNYANQLILSEAAEDGTVVLAQNQTGGKGQKGNHWESEAGKNLLMSIIWFPDFLPAAQQFLISKVVSLGIIDFLNNIEIENCKIKWPNDIYVGDRKLAGILIENSIKGSNLFSSVAGIGLNVKQQVFLSDALNPVSLQQISGSDYDISELLDSLLASLDFWYKELANNEEKKINDFYFSNLYRNAEWCLFSEPGKQSFEAKISGIGKFGQLQLQLRDEIVREYMFKEVEFVLR